MRQSDQRAERKAGKRKDMKLSEENVKADLCDQLCQVLSSD